MRADAEHSGPVLDRNKGHFEQLLTPAGEQQSGCDCVVVDLCDFEGEQWQFEIFANPADLHKNAAEKRSAHPPRLEAEPRHHQFLQPGVCAGAQKASAAGQGPCSKQVFLDS